MIWIWHGYIVMIRLVVNPIFIVGTEMTRSLPGLPCASNRGPEPFNLPLNPKSLSLNYLWATREPALLSCLLCACDRGRKDFVLSQRPRTKRFCSVPTTENQKILTQSEPFACDFRLLSELLPSNMCEPRQKRRDDMSKLSWGLFYLWVFPRVHLGLRLAQAVTHVVRADPFHNTCMNKIIHNSTSAWLNWVIFRLILLLSKRRI